MVGETGFEPATPWSRTTDPAISPIAPESTQAQTVDFTAQRTAAGSHTDTQIAPKRAATTAKSLRNSRTVSGSSERPLQAEREWLTPAEVALKLQVSRATVYALIARGELRATRVGLSLRIHAGPLAAFLSR